MAETRVAGDLDPARLDFGYRLKGDRADLRPTQVFDDGAKTYILFPATIAQSELPPLFLIGEGGKAELVNYRVSGRYMIVDRLFAVAELRLGTRKAQTVRSEEHTSELQSLMRISYAVFCLKKKNKQKSTNIT